MESLRQGLKDAGVPESQVFFEMFTKASKPAVEHSTIDPQPEHDGAEHDGEVVFARSNKTVNWQASDNILEFAEANGLNPPYSCRQGICGTCQCKLLEGDVEYVETPTATIEDGSALICISKPKTSRLVLDL